MLGRIKSYFFKGKNDGALKARTIESKLLGKLIILYEVNCVQKFALGVGWWSQSVPLIAKTFRVEDACQIVLNPVLSTGAVVEHLSALADDSDVRVATTGPPTSTWLATIYDIACATFA
jgi:hypothetical protein